MFCLPCASQSEPVVLAGRLGDRTNSFALCLDGSVEPRNYFAVSHVFQVLPWWCYWQKAQLYCLCPKGPPTSPLWLALCISKPDSTGGVDLYRKATETERRPPTFVVGVGEVTANFLSFYGLNAHWRSEHINSTPGAQLTVYCHLKCSP